MLVYLTKMKPQCLKENYSLMIRSFELDLQSLTELNKNLKTLIQSPQYLDKEYDR